MAILRLCFLVLVFLQFATWNVLSQNEEGFKPPSANQRAPSSVNSNPVFRSDVNMDEFRKQLMYPFDSSHLADITPYKPTHEISLTFRLPFFGFAYSYVWLSKDGYVMFNQGTLNSDYPVHFPSRTLNLDKGEQDPALIAPWFSQQSFSSLEEDSAVYCQVVNIKNPTDYSLAERLKLDFREGMIGASDFTPTFAIIVTWKNVTIASKMVGQELTNTYQLVLATDETRTYCIFNFEWITWISHEDTQGGKKGNPVFVGFNAGNRTRAYEFLPYSQNPRLSLLPSGGFGNNLKGRYFFQIDEEVWPGCCLKRELEPNWPDRPRLTFFPRYGNMLGGTMVNITGPCLENENSIITCKFDTISVEGIYRDINHATCISPPVMYHGYVDLSVSIDEGSYLFLGRYYIQPPEFARDEIIVLEGNDRLYNPPEMIVTWKYHYLVWDPKASVSLHLWGYRENVESYPRLTYIDTLSEDDYIQVGKQKYQLDLERFKTRWNSNVSDITFGFIGLKLNDPKILGENIKVSPVLWSRPMPTAWYFRPQWEKKHKNWREYFCEDWYTREKYNDRFAITVFRCPCTLHQAELDRGRFSPDSQCNVIDRKCDTFHRAAQHCVRSGRPAVGGAGQLCCYDDHGELMRTGDTMYGGRPSRSFKYGKHPFKQRTMIPTLSHWLHDTMPFFFCCKWTLQEDDAETCAMYKYWRTSQDCSLYQPPAVSSLYGDPHIITFDRLNYTFNGLGEFVLLQVNSPVHKLSIHGRFEEVPKKHRLDPRINGTRLTAIAIKDNASSIVEFRLRPDAARWRYHMNVIVDKEYIFFWDDTLRTQNFKGVTLYMPSGTWNVSHVVAMFDSGAGIEAVTDNTHMSLHIYLPRTFLYKTSGLLGNWSLTPDDDFTLPNGDVLPSSMNSRDIYRRFGKTWRLKETEQPNVKASLFFHDSIPYSEYDDTYFEPEFEKFPLVPANFTFPASEVNRVCSDSVPCRYDFIVTGNRDYAMKTKKREAISQRLASAVREETIRCPEISRPLHGRKSEIRYYIGTVVRFSCDDGYRLVGYEFRRCRETGLWSWGIEAECISDRFYSGKVAGIAVGIIVPILLILIIIAGCLIIRQRNRRDHYTGEKGLPLSYSITELPENGKRGKNEDSGSSSTGEHTKLETET